MLQAACSADDARFSRNRLRANQDANTGKTHAPSRCGRLDGMRRDLIGEATTPGLVRFADRAQSFAAHRSMFPSATRVVSASFATGCHPGRHELQGNTLALLENGRLVYHDAGHPDFLQHKRRATGRSLAVPTLAERLSPHGGMILFSTVSPGRPTRTTLTVTVRLPPRRLVRAGRTRIERTSARHCPGHSWERRMTERSSARCWSTRKPALAIHGWATGCHAACAAAGSPEHLWCAPGRCQRGAVVKRWSLADKGDAMLLIVCSDLGIRRCRASSTSRRSWWRGLERSRESGAW